MEKTESNTEKRKKVYEVGYLLIPTIPEEHLASEVQNIKTVIEKNDGEFITEDFPKLRQLAYTMRRASVAQNAKFDKAYFGWVKFESSSVAIPTIQAALDKNTNVLRSMIINTVRENTLYVQKPAYRSPDVAVKPEEAKEKMSEEEIDKTIENLVVE